jgi:hypothetical protein
MTRERRKVESDAGGKLIISMVDEEFVVEKIYER